MSCSVILTDTFKACVKKLKRKYARIVEDLGALLAELESGELPGDAIPGLDGSVYKTRVASSDMKRGKSGSFRVLYYREEQATDVYLLVIYAKAERETIGIREIRALLSALGTRSPRVGAPAGPPDGDSRRLEPTAVDNDCS